MRRQVWRQRGTTTAKRAALLCFVLLFAGFSADAAIYQVGVYDYFFEPFELSVKTGDTVEWTANGFGHTVVSDTRVFDSSTVWGGSSIPALRSFKFTFHQPGTYPYYSLDYGGPEGVGMSGTITVIGSPTNQIPFVPANGFPVANATNQPIRAELRASAFSDGDAGDVHIASQWAVRRASDNQIVYDSGEVIDDGQNFNSKTNRFLPDGLLNYGAIYQWQVRYKDSYGAWSAYSQATSFSTLAPMIRMNRQGATVVFSWPVNAEGFVLEYATDISSPTWTVASPLPQALNNQNVVTNDLPGTVRIYRLRKP